MDTLTRNCKKHDIDLYGLNSDYQGIVHVIGPQLGVTQPGMTIVCGDSHTSTHGAFGCVAFGIGTSEVEMVLATQCILQPKPKKMRINIEGELKKGVTAKDIILYIISQLTAGGGTGYFVEYAGSAIRNLSMEGRMTICNMSIEMGARGGLPGGIITYSFQNGTEKVSAHNRKRVTTLSFDEKGTCAREEIERALIEYEKIGNFTFQAEEDDSNSSIRFFIADDEEANVGNANYQDCLLYTSDAADE